MNHTITVRLTPELAEWLAATARETGLPQGKIVRDQLEMAAVHAPGRLRFRPTGPIVASGLFPPDRQHPATWSLTIPTACIKA